MVHSYNEIQACMTSHVFQKHLVAWRIAHNKILNNNTRHKTEYVTIPIGKNM